MAMDRKEFEKRKTRELLWIIYSQGVGTAQAVADLKRMVRQMAQTEQTEMALIDNFQTEIQDMQDDIKANADAAASAKTAIETLLAQVNSLVTNASDINTLKSDFAQWHQNVTANTQAISDAVAEGTQPAPAPSP